MKEVGPLMFDSDFYMIYKSYTSLCPPTRNRHRSFIMHQPRTWHGVPALAFVTDVWWRVQADHNYYVDFLLGSQRFPNGSIALQNATLFAMNIVFTFCSRVSIVSVVPSIFSGALSFIMYMVVPSSGDIFFPLFSGVGWLSRLTIWYIEPINCILLHSWTDGWFKYTLRYHESEWIWFEFHTWIHIWMILMGLIIHCQI